MKQDNKQIPQLIVLGVLVLACVSYVSFKVMRPGPARPTEAPAATTTESSPVSQPEAAVVVMPDAGAFSVFPDLARVLDRRDPFAPQPLPGAKQNTSVSVQTPRPRPLNTQPMPFGKLPKIDVKPFNPFGGSGNTAVLPNPPTDTPQEPKFTLTGVVRGTENVAILRSGEGGRYVVRQGQTIEGRYRVIMVMGDAVVLSDRGRRIYVRLGGEQNAS